MKNSRKLTRCWWQATAGWMGRGWRFWWSAAWNGRRCVGGNCLGWWFGLGGDGRCGGARNLFVRQCKSCELAKDIPDIIARMLFDMSSNAYVDGNHIGGGVSPRLTLDIERRPWIVFSCAVVHVHRVVRFRCLLTVELLFVLAATWRIRKGLLAARIVTVESNSLAKKRLSRSSRTEKENFTGCCLRDTWVRRADLHGNCIQDTCSRIH